VNTADFIQHLERECRALTIKATCASSSEEVKSIKARHEKRAALLRHLKDIPVHEKMMGEVRA